VGTGGRLSCSLAMICWVLNKMGIEPLISNHERCCGHDALWSRDNTAFKKLATWNLKVIQASFARIALQVARRAVSLLKNIISNI
jgi:hypothetical protein